MCGVAFYFAEGSSCFSYINAVHLIWIIIVPHRKTHFVFLCTVLGRWSALFPPPSKVDRAGQDKIEGSLWFTSTACTSYISQPTDTPEPGNFHRTFGNSSRRSLAGFASKSSLPCPGEEAPPRPKSLVGVGTWGLQVIALGPRRRPGLRFPPRPGATQPSRPVCRGAVAATKDFGRTTQTRGGA